MIQDLPMGRLENTYQNAAPSSGSRILCFLEGRALIRREEDDSLQLPSFSVWKGWKDESGRADVRREASFRYLFRIAGTEYYLWLGRPVPEADVREEGYHYEKVGALRQLVSKDVCFAVMTAWHLAAWYRDNRYCGRCGKETAHDGKERMLRCPSCGNMIFPKIAPAVIVAVTDHDRILLSKYADRDYKKYALLAGFTEIGETAEETVRREVMEEVGLRVKNIRYYKSQPWGVDSNLLLGFFCELDGEDRIDMDTRELALAEWFDRGNLPAHDDGISLTREMMRIFEEGRN